MRLLVVLGSPPLCSISFEVAGWRSMNAQPPGPGLPLQPPSVKSWTSADLDSVGMREGAAVEVGKADCRRSIGGPQCEMRPQDYTPEPWACSVDVSVGRTSATRAL